MKWCHGEGAASKSGRGMLRAVMPALTVHRPVWRRFDARFYERAVEWVRAGGAAAIVHPSARPAGSTAGAPRSPRVDMLLRTDERGQITELGLWALLSISQRRWVRVATGPATGLGLARAQSHAVDAVLDWCERDGIHARPTRRLRLDCLACGACCHDSNVQLGDDDLERFRSAGRDDLLGSRFIQRRGGKIRLRFAPGGRCQHLERDLRCRIYAIRPFNCSVFPVGSEACLAARESTLQLRDGAPED